MVGRTWRHGRTDHSLRARRIVTEKLIFFFKSPTHIFFQIREGSYHNCSACHQQRDRRRGHGRRTKSNPTIHL